MDDQDRRNDQDLVRNLDAQQCDASKCSGNRVCGEGDEAGSCVCSLGYSGESCQNRPFQGPLLYGAVAAGTGLVALAVLAFIIKRRKDSR